MLASARAEQFDVTPSRLVADGGLRLPADMVGWLVDERAGSNLHVKLMDKSERTGREPSPAATSRDSIPNATSMRLSRR